MSATYLELLLEMLPGADRAGLQERLRQQGLDPLPMKAGFLLSAELADLRKVLPSLTGTETDEVSIPEDLKDDVRAIRIFKPRSLHGP